MGEILQTNLFFFITGSAVIIITVFLTIVLYHLIKAVRSVRRIIERIEAGSEVLADDFDHMRNVVTGTGAMLTHLLGLKAILRNEVDDDEDDEERPARKARRKSKL
jgi:uncharacterized protein YqhQ